MGNKVNITSKTANFIREKRLALGMSQRQFSVHIFGDGKRKDWISRIENGQPITLTTMERIFEKIGADIRIIEE